MPPKRKLFISIEIKSCLEGIMKKAFSSRKAQLVVLVVTIAMYILAAGAPGCWGGAVG